jgi:hypothetical protein
VHGQRVPECGSQGVQADLVPEASTDSQDGGDLCEPGKRDYLHGHGAYQGADPSQARQKVSEALTQSEERGHSRVKRLQLIQQCQELKSAGHAGTHRRHSRGLVHHYGKATTRCRIVSSL